MVYSEEIFMENAHTSRTNNLSFSLHLLVFFAFAGVLLFSLLRITYVIVHHFFQTGMVYSLVDRNIELRSHLALWIVLFPLFTISIFFLRKIATKHRQVLENNWMRAFLLIPLGVPTVFGLIYVVWIISEILGGNIAWDPIITLVVAAIVMIPFLLLMSRLFNGRYLSTFVVRFFVSYYVVISILLFIAGFLQFGPPWLTKIIRDERSRIEAAHALTLKIQDYFYQFKTLPSNFDDLTKIPYEEKNLVDQSTTQNFTYAITGNETYRLCSQFQLSSDLLKKYGYAYEEKYNHPAGQGCLDLSVSPIFCRTLNTKMYVGQNNLGQIGCDVEVFGNIYLPKSYCESQTTLRREPLIYDAFGRKNRYFATLNQLQRNEEVKVFAYTSTGLKVECLPSLNK